MATAVILTSVTATADGRRLVAFSDGSGYEFANLAELQSWARQPDTDVDLTRRMCVGYAMARSANLSNLAAVQGKSFIFDLSAPSPIKVQ